MATFSLACIFGAGFSYFLMQACHVALKEAALSGAALLLAVFLITNYCICFKASHVQELNKTIEDSASDFTREIDDIVSKQSLAKHSRDKISQPAIEAENEDGEVPVSLTRLMVFVESLMAVRKLQLALDLVE